MKKSHTKTGFTLIELLVVVAIIALLTSIVVVNMAEARRKGRNAGRNTQVREYVKAIELYRTNYNLYPNPVDNTPYCLGEQDNCAITITDINGPVFSSYGPSPALKTALGQYVSGYPPIDTRSIQFGPTNFHKGAVYTCNISNNECIKVYIYWTQEGTSPQGTICGPGNIDSSNSGNVVCRYSLN
jgi:prepilin-type N-terminal cleavage/methylation domain-containing protein